MHLAKLKVHINRDAKVSYYPFLHYFKGFENVDAVQQLFGEQTEQVLKDLKIEFIGRRGYMGVSNQDGHLIISAHYLKNGDLLDIYLDIIHELVHVRQFMDGKELFDSNYNYVERPTEIEAYHYVVEEAKKLGLDNKRICDYLKTEWMSREDLAQLTKALKLMC